MQTKQEKKLADILERHLIEQNERDYKRAQHAACYASWNIHFGPDSFTHYGDAKYCAALNRIKRFVENYLTDTLYIDLDSDCVSTKLDEGYTDEETGEYVEPYLDNTYQIEPREARKLLFGVSAEYI